MLRTIHVKSVVGKFPASFLTGQAKKHEVKAKEIQKLEIKELVY